MNKITEINTGETVTAASSKIIEPNRCVNILTNSDANIPIEGASTVMPLTIFFWGYWMLKVGFELKYAFSNLFA